MSLKAHFQLMANYNRWMNKSLYESASQLGNSELSEDKGAFFGSILATLNHIMVGDTIWLKHFTNHPSELKSLDYIRGLKVPETLNTMLYTELSRLQDARVKMDKTIIEFVHELTEDIISTPLQYKNLKGEPFSKNLGLIIHHFFNHQTHHRGQVSTLLYQVGIDIGVTGLLAGIPNE